MQRYLRVPRPRFFGAPLYVHWSVLATMIVLVLISFENVGIALVSISAYLSILLLHECGHAWFAHRERLEVICIRVAMLHGSCHYQAPHYEISDIRIAWGGVLFQLAVAIPVLIADAVFGLAKYEYIGQVVLFLGYVNLGIAALNLIPMPGLDGELAWRYFADWPSRLRRRRKKKSRWT